MVNVPGARCVLDPEDGFKAGSFVSTGGVTFCTRADSGDSGASSDECSCA